MYHISAFVCVCMYEHLSGERSWEPYIYPTKTAARLTQLHRDSCNRTRSSTPALDPCYGQLHHPLCMFCKSGPSPNSLCTAYSHHFSISFSGGSRTDAGTPVPAARSRWIRALLRSAQPGMSFSGPLINQSHWVLKSVHNSERAAPIMIVVN